MNIELLISLLSSTIILVLSIVIPLVLGTFLITKLWDFIDEPSKVIIDKVGNTPEEKKAIAEEYYKLSEPYTLRLIDDHPDTYQDGRRYFEKPSIVEAEVKKVEVEEARKIFEAKFPNFFSELEGLKKKQKIPRVIFTFISWGIAVVLFFSSTVLFYVATGYFGVNISVQSYKQAAVEKQSQDEITKALLGDLGDIASDLTNPRSLTLDQIEQITEKLPPAVSKLQSNLEKTDTQIRELQQSLKIEQEELDIQKAKFDTVRALSAKEFEAVKTILFEETEKSTRRYYLIGLFSSIPLFWFSELLKALFLTWLGRLKRNGMLRSQKNKNLT